MSEKLASVLAERYDCIPRQLVPPVYNALRVTVGGKACVAKLIHYYDDDGEGGAFNKRRKAGFAMEKYVYPRLRGWPVARGQRRRDANDPWGSYVPSADSDAAVARSLLKQVRAIHRLGVAHGDLILKNIMFRKPRGVAVIDFAARAEVGLLERSPRVQSNARHRVLCASRAREARRRRNARL
jgi:hypothetical protein